MAIASSRPVISSSSSPGEAVTRTSTSAKRASTSSSPRRAASKPAKRAKRIAAKPAKRPVAKRAAARPVKRASAKPAKRAATKRPAARRAPANRWLRFVERHGVVLASARGPVPSVAEAVAGQPIIGSWWAHPKGKAIFDALSELDDSDDVRCFKLIDGKVTFVHRRVWPALARLASDGVIAAPRVASLRQEHMPTGEHRNMVTQFPDWVPDDVARAATALSVEDARAQLGAWI
jgi:hypothetical protein